ncbi:MAG: hypothetical protein P8K79_00605 [Mariniblastus sp.]|nr:hypothetical protein [Mariniblastus sp.]
MRSGCYTRPHFSTQGDVVRLVYLVEPLAREPIHTYEPFAGRLVDYVLAEQQRVRRHPWTERSGRQSI